MVISTKASPFEKKLNFNVPGHADVENIFTLGAGSYIEECEVKLWEENINSPHILAGRFNSWSDKIKILIGGNHSQRDVTTFPFDVQKIIDGVFGNDNPQVKKLPYNRPNRFQVIVGNDVWIGHRVMIMGGVKIGNGALIGANAVVAKNIPPYAIAVGNPARVIKYRFDDTTIKKLLAIKWWNWSLEKIADNLPLMKNIEKFLAVHWSPELENIPTDEIGWQVENFRAQGFKIYNFVADFQAKKPLWLRVIAGFCQSNFTDAKLIIWLVENSSESYFKLLAEAAKLFDNGAIKNILVVENEKISPYALRSATHFITNREMVTLECLDWLWNTNVKIVSALDDGIFDGEPLVDWKNLYC